MKSINYQMCLPVLCLSLSGTITRGTLRADDALGEELRAMVNEHVMPLLEKRGGGSIAVGAFTAASNIVGSAGPEIQLQLSQLLQDARATVQADNYRYELTGNYLPYNDRDSGLQGVKLVGRLIDAEDGTTLGEFPRFVFGSEAVPKLLGLTVSTKGSNDPRVQSAVFRKAIEQPSSYILGSQVSSTASSPFAMEVLLQREGSYVPLPIVLQGKSRPFIEVAHQDTYAIRLVNRSEDEAAVLLTIDGVNVFEFSQLNPKPRYWIVPPQRNGQAGTTIVRGWDSDGHNSWEFKIVDFPDSAASRVQLQPTAGIGMITASFSACWKDEADRPRSEGRTRATGFGREILDTKTEVHRQVGAVRDVISIRYDRDSDPSPSIAVSR